MVQNEIKQNKPQNFKIHPKKELSNPLNDYFNQFSGNPVRDEPPGHPISGPMGLFQPTQQYPQMPVRPGTFAQDQMNSNFQGRGFVNSGDLLVQQFLLENIQKQKGMLLKA